MFDFIPLPVLTHTTGMTQFQKKKKKGDALSPLLFNFALEYVIRRVEVNKNALKLNGTHQLLVYADGVMLGGSVHSIKKNTETLLVSCTEIGLEVNADETKYMVMSPDQNAG